MHGQSEGPSLVNLWSMYPKVACGHHQPQVMPRGPLRLKMSTECQQKAPGPTRPAETLQCRSWGDNLGAGGAPSSKSSLAGVLGRRGRRNGQIPIQPENDRWAILRERQSPGPQRPQASPWACNGRFEPTKWPKSPRKYRPGRGSVWSWVQGNPQWRSRTARGRFPG